MSKTVDELARRTRMSVRMLQARARSHARHTAGGVDMHPVTARVLQTRYRHYRYQRREQRNYPPSIRYRQKVRACRASARSPSLASSGPR